MNTLVAPRVLIWICAALSSCAQPESDSIPAASDGSPVGIVAVDARYAGTQTATQSSIHPDAFVQNLDVTVSTGMATTDTSGADASLLNRPPVISGSPLTSITAGQTYYFQPIANDANGDTLTFRIANKPAWATFNASTGALTGTPPALRAGLYPNILIYVSDGQANAFLSWFSIFVTDSTAPINSGTANITWSVPTRNVSGSLLTNLGGYKLYHGTDIATLNDVRIVGANSGAYDFTALPAGTHYFAISAFNTEGAESSLLYVGAKTIP